MALLRILLSLSIGFVSTQSFGQDASAAKAAGAEATEPLIPHAQKISIEANKFGIASGTVSAAAEKLKPPSSSCETKKTMADYACLEKLNPGILEFVSKHGTIAQIGLTMGASLTEQCGTISNTLNTAGMVLGAYQAACKGAQALCVSSCGNVPAAVANVRSATKSAISQLQAKLVAEETTNTGCSGCNSAGVAKAKTELTNAQAANSVIENELVQIDKYETYKTQVCKVKYKISTETAMMGAIGALKGLAQSKACEKANKDSQIASVNCFDSAAPGYSTPNCQCARGEKSAAECQNINVDPATIKQASINAPKPVSAADGAGSPTGGLGSISGGDEKAKIAATSGGDGSAPPVDGGGGGMGGGGSGGGYGQDGAGTTRRLNTNILGGGFGGGGGGGGSGAGAGYGEMDSNLKTYMPGGANDPNRSIASQLAKEVTPQAGRTNWEKVRLRYRDNTGSLLNK